MVKTYLKVIGVVFVLIGVLGFVDPLTSGDELFGLFAVDTTHNVVHLLSGVVALAAAMASNATARLCAQVLGVVYGAVTVLGFLGGDNAHVLGVLHVNTEDNVLHLLIALSALYAGFAPEPKAARA